VADRVLTVAGEKRHDEERHEGGTLLSERRYGAFTRSLRLPEDADPAQIDAHFKKGVLIVQVRKDENAAGRVRRIEVKKD
jgi:HSP20 family protein